MIEDSTMKELIHSLQSVISALDGLVNALGDTKANVLPNEEAAEEAAPLQQTDDAAKPQETTPTDAPASEKIYSFEDVRKAMSDAAGNGHREDVKAILTKHNVQRLSKLPKEAYAEVIAEVEALNA